MSTASSRARGYLIRFLAVAILLAITAEILFRIVVVPFQPTARQINTILTGELRDATIGDSQFDTDFPASDTSVAQYDGFAGLSRGGLNVSMIRQIVTRYYRDKQPGRVVLLAGPQLFAAKRIASGTANYEILNQNSPRQYLYIANPIVSRYILQGLARAARSTVAGNAMPDWSRVGKTKRIRQTQGRVTLQAPIPDLAASGDFATYRGLVEELKRRGAEVCLIRPPVTNDYLGMADRLPTFGAALETLRELARKEGVRFVDFRDLPMQYPDSKFMNQDHLNPRGAAEFAPLALAACFAKPHAP